MARTTQRSSKTASSTRGTTSRPATKRSQTRPPRHEPTRGLYGWITHTDLGSSDPAATRAWCSTVLGWTFQPPFQMPDGSEYHLFAYAEKGGGGIRQVKPPEQPASLPYVHVQDAHAAFDQALRAGAEAVSPPQRVTEGVTIAIVRAPGGVVIGLSGP